MRVVLTIQNIHFSLIQAVKVSTVSPIPRTCSLLFLLLSKKALSPLQTDLVCRTMPLHWLDSLKHYITSVVIVFDTCTLHSLQARAGTINTTEVLRLFPSYTDETSYTVWESLISNLTVLDRLLSYTDLYDDFKKYAVKLFIPIATRLGWDTRDTDSKSIL